MADQQSKKSSTRKSKSTKTPKPSSKKVQQLDEATLNSIKEQVYKQLKSEQESERIQAQKKKEDEIKTRKEYVEKMKASPDPWVEVLGIAETSSGIRVELDWNDSFVKYLRDSGVAGTDNDQVVQRWVTLLLQDMVEGQNTKEPQQKSDFE